MNGLEKHEIRNELKMNCENIYMEIKSGEKR